jgi:hypothetical protein
MSYIFMIRHAENKAARTERLFWDACVQHPDSFVFRN